jgi:hypothetical protein
MREHAACLSAIHHNVGNVSFRTCTQLHAKLDVLSLRLAIAGEVSFL